MAINVVACSLMDRPFQYSCLLRNFSISVAVALSNSITNLFMHVYIYIYYNLSQWRIDHVVYKSFITNELAILRDRLYSYPVHFSQKRNHAATHYYIFFWGEGGGGFFFRIWIFTLQLAISFMVLTLLVN